MNQDQVLIYIESALTGLKDFQQASVEHLVDGFFEHNQRCMLLADEVGLGKTIVARGVIATVLKKRIESGKKGLPLKVAYICSNQVIAKENLRKLNILPTTQNSIDSVSRITYLAEANPNQDQSQWLDLITLTPSASFHTTSGMGNHYERRLIYAAILHDDYLKAKPTQLHWVLKGGCTFESFEKDINIVRHRELRPGIAEIFLEKIKAFTIDKTDQKLVDFKLSKTTTTLYQLVCELADKINKKNHESHRDVCRFIGIKLRQVMIEECLTYVDADLFILDEFQRFRELLDEENDTPQARIARRIFFKQGQESRVLLLSATPFKAFSNFSDLERGEDHYRDFRSVLQFLLRGDQALLDQYDKHRQSLYEQLLTLDSESLLNLDATHKQAVEQILRSVICRTERQLVADNPQALVEDTWKSDRGKLAFGPGDIANFILADRLAEALTKIGCPTIKPIEYCKSALYPFSFLDNYKVKEQLRKNRKQLTKDLNLSRAGWLDYKEIDNYQWSAETAPNDPQLPANARLKMLFKESEVDQSSRLLWVPPSLPYYPLSGPFAENKTFSKTLVFSSWVMVPRMIATLVSYEVEKQTVAHPAAITTGESVTYFGKQRKPAPQLTFTARRKRKQASTSMSNFTLLYPSATLIKLLDPLENLEWQRDQSELFDFVVERIEQCLNESELTEYANPKGESERWYWAAPLLLDRSSEGYKDSIEEFFGKLMAKNHKSDAKDSHIENLNHFFQDPSVTELGPIPNDLAETLAMMLLGSPAITAARSLHRQFHKQSLDECLFQGYLIADEFVTLFNKPESISAIRLSTTGDTYWRRVLDYCSAGCLQAVLDEYLHLLKEQNIDFEGVTQRMREAINLKTASVDVDSLDSFMDHTKKRKMRTHFAVEFGNQKTEDDQGQNRVSGMREVFNSPFRPFVLASTSIGQEGLDFHQYCRRIVHWNLPSNPIDLEQREGRINRYKSHVIRQQIALKYSDYFNRSEHSISHVAKTDVWRELFKIADLHEREKKGKNDLVPSWHVEAVDGPKIERIIPMYPFSQDEVRLKKMLQTLTIYRLAFGQPRQSELVDHLLNTELSKDDIKAVMDQLMINLSPLNK